MSETVINDSPFSNQLPDIRKDKPSEDYTNTTSDPYKTGKVDSQGGENTDVTGRAEVATRQLYNSRVPFLIEKQSKPLSGKVQPYNENIKEVKREKSFAGSFMTAMSSFYQEPELKEDVTVADTP